MSKPCIPLHLVKVGALITPRFFLTNELISHWTFAKECADVGGGLIAGTAQLEVVEVSPLTLNAVRWLKVAVAGSSPQKLLKLTAEEYMSKFLSV